MSFTPRAALATVVLVAGIGVGTGCAGSRGSEPATMTGFSATAATEQRRLEGELAAMLDPGRVDGWFRELTRQPHPAGSARTRQIAEWIAERFREFGLDEVRLHRYDVYLPLPPDVSVEMIAPTPFVASLREDAYEVDPDTDVDLGPAYLGMSAAGDVTGELIYAHSGNPEDYEWLESQGIDPAGKVAIVRYSVPYSYRGFKAWEAERRGVAALLVYSDPLEDGFHKGEVFPDGPWGPESHIQRGAITYDFIVPGDPLTPGWASVEGARRIPIGDARSVPDVIAVPMSYRDAQALLQAAGGPEVPEAWRGGLPITYRAGGDGATARVRVEHDDAPVRPIWVVEGRITGSAAPDELVVVGNHHDAWAYGGVDPSSGTATMLELARALGELAQRGERPRRTIVFGSWDAEEWHLTGSTEWGEQLEDELRAQAVAYINVDSSVSGHDFGASAVASLSRTIVEVARDSVDPQGRGSLLDSWRNQGGRGDGVIATAVRNGDRGGDDLGLVVTELGSGSDYTVFLNFLGIPVVDMHFDGPYGVYHSVYDNYYRMTTLVDPGLRTMTAMAGIWGAVTLRLANADILPYDMEHYAARVDAFVDGLGAIAGAADLDLDGLRAAIAAWRTAGTALQRARADALAGGIDPVAARGVNAALRAIERQLLLATPVGDGVVVSEGIPGRRWFRHGLYAPRYTYAAMSLPGVTEALEAGDAARARAEVDRLETAISDAATMTREAIALLSTR